MKPNSFAGAIDTQKFLSRISFARIIAPVVILLFSVCARGAQVEFWFSGMITGVDVRSNGLPASITAGKPFTGYLFYDTEMVGSSNLNHYPEGDRGNYYFYSTAGFKLVIQTGGHTFASSNSPGAFSCGYVGVDNDLSGADAMNVDSGNAQILLDGESFLKYPEFAILSFFLKDSSSNAYSSILIPTNAPTLAQFPTTRAMNITGRYDDGHSMLFSVAGVITNISATPQVMLNVHRPSPDTVQLAWPLVANGFTLQSRTNLALGDWEDVVSPIVDSSTDHTVTIPSKGNQFFRLKK